MLLPLLILLTPLPLLAQNAPPPPPSPRTWDSTLAPPTPAGPFLTARPTWVPSDIAAPPPPGAAPTDAGRWSSIYESLLSAGKIPSTLTAAPWPTGSYGPGQGPYPGPGRGGKPGGGPGGWGGPAGAPPFGPSNFGPYSQWSTRSDWRKGPWTSWWDGSACPASDWPGWTAGPWATSPPWYGDG
ncbi:hypothetical protein PTT_06928 [Pyrenophora teres f. teres 0-1]|uniref:Uncharacterized protein n=1 Tax=Pyrenophora teres f. teres (strain 0-1) TaxID=861557 RepID=E3RGJ3_PYRTT|nr:hypothetical protein PTT_06928 [Pyrenophora teres f. teres 0-1]